jgi:hypothetical protein
VSSSSVAPEDGLMQPGQPQRGSDEGRSRIAPSCELRYSTLLVNRSLPVRRPCLRRTYRQRQRGRCHGDLCPGQPGRSGCRAGRADRRAPSARHDRRVVTGMAAVAVGASSPTDPGPRGPGPVRTAGPAIADRSPAGARLGRTVRSWPLLVLVAAARAIVDAFEAQPNRGVLNVGARMVDRTRLMQARGVIQRAEATAD